MRATQINNWQKSRDTARAAAAAASSPADGPSFTEAALGNLRNRGKEQRAFVSRGRKSCSPAFEAGVLARLVYLVLNKAQDDPKVQACSEDPCVKDDRPRAFASVLASAMYSYELIITAAEQERRLPQYQGEKAVQDLCHPPSNGWVRGLLDRHRFSLRRATTVTKSTRPQPSEVRDIMEDIQKLIVQHKIPLRGVINGDEYVFPYVFAHLQPRAFHRYHLPLPPPLTPSLSTFF